MEKRSLLILVALAIVSADVAFLYARGGGGSCNGRNFCSRGNAYSNVGHACSRARATCSSLAKTGVDRTTAARARNRTAHQNINKN